MHPLTKVIVTGNLLMLLLSACSTPQARSGTSPAVVHGVTSWDGGILGAERQVFILGVDGKPTKGFFGGPARHVRVAPGRHTLKAGYFAQGESPSSVGGLGSPLIAPRAPSLLSVREFTFDAEAATSYLLRFDTAVWDAQKVPIWLQEEISGRVVGSSQTMTRLYGTAFCEPLTLAGLKRGVFVVSVDSVPVKLDPLRGPVPIFLEPGQHEIDVVDVSTGWEPPRTSSDRLGEILTRLPVIDLLAYSLRPAGKWNQREHHLVFNARDGGDYLVRFDTTTWDASQGSVWLEDTPTGAVPSF